MIPGELDAEGKMERGIALRGIAEAAQDLQKAGADDLEVQTFIQGSKRELARERPDIRKMGEAAAAAKMYKEELAKGQ